MAAEAPQITRDGTMEMTAKEGIAFLEKEKPELADKIKQLKEDGNKKPSNGAGDAPAPENGTAKVPRDNTMVQTAQEGVAYLQRSIGGIHAMKEHGLDMILPEAISELKTPRLSKGRTMLETAEEGKEYLEKEGGVNEEAKTRSQEKELNDSKTEEKEATKRSAEEETEETDDAKKQKVEEENGAAEKEAPKEDAAEQAKE